MQRSQNDFNLSDSQAPSAQVLDNNEIFQMQLHELRKDSDFIRTQIFILMNEVCAFIEQNSDHKNLNIKLEYAGDLLSCKTTQELITTIKHLECVVKETFLTQEQNLNDINQQIDATDKTLQTRKQVSQQKADQLSRGIKQIAQKFQRLSLLERELEEINTDHKAKINQLIQSEIKRNSFKQAQKRRIFQSWQNQATQIKRIIKDRFQARSQVQRVNLAVNKLEQKNEQLRNISSQYERAKQENQKIYEQNIKLRVIVDKEQLRKRTLLEKTREQVLNKEIIMAGEIAQNWNSTEQKSRQLLFEIIEAINAKLQTKQLIEVQQIIRHAEEYMSSEGCSSEKKKFRSAQLLQDNI